MGHMWFKRRGITKNFARSHGELRVRAVPSAFRHLITRPECERELKCGFHLATRSYASGRSPLCLSWFDFPESKNELNVNGVAYGSSVGPNSGPKAKRQQDVAQFTIVAAVPRRIETEERRASLLIHVEPGDEMISLEPSRRRERRKEKLRWRRRICASRPATRARPRTAAGSRTGTRPDSAAAPRTRAGQAGVSASGTWRDRADVRLGSRCRLRCNRHGRNDRLWSFNRLRRHNGRCGVGSGT